MTILILLFCALAGYKLYTFIVRPILSAFTSLVA